MTDTELQPAPKEIQCCAVNGNLKRCLAKAEWQGLYHGFIVCICSKHAKSIGWPVGESMADDED